MPSDLVQTIGRGAGASTIAAAVEAEIARGRLAPAARLPAVRDLAGALQVSPATVAAAYRTLRQRGFVVTGRGRGTSVAALPPVRVGLAEPPAGVRDLARGNPDPALLPPLAGALAGIDPAHKLYGGPTKLPELAELAAAEFAADGIAGEMAVTCGALDALERALQTELRPGDAVAVEDPSWPRIADLVRALGLVVVPVAVDRHGLDPGQLERALRAGARAVIVTPRGQNPTGAAVSAARGRALRALLARHPGVLALEDDYLARVAGAPYVPVHHQDGRWAVVRSLSKDLGPDLRLALVAGDQLTIARIEGRQHLGQGWASHLLQQVAARLLGAAATGRRLAAAERTYTERRQALVAALAARGIAAQGDSGLGVWVPLADEAAAVGGLLVRGWAVSPGERFRLRAGPGIRVTTATLAPAEAEALAEDLAELARPGGATYAG